MELPSLLKITAEENFIALKFVAPEGEISSWVKSVKPCPARDAKSVRHLKL